ncbi:hypothetical protein QQF64_030739 [Cirrhinus molitorella]|uniref:G-protein coupled receptors family 1 profile domain-containing protein n=1 Tax=Cirrhinus molitorella TaxID=172907 RepID=A0ABR3N4B5_9TELE
MYIAVFMLGKYLVGRPTMNCLICLERFVAVVYPVLFHKFSTLRLRYVCVAMAWMVTWSFGAYAIFSYPQIPLKIYSIFLTASLLCITACSLGVLKALLKPSPGDKEKEVMRKKKKRKYSYYRRLTVEHHPFLACALLDSVAGEENTSTFLVGRPLFQTVFCVERYLAVVYPLVYLKYTKNPRMKLLLVVLVWLIILVLGSFIMNSYPKMPVWLAMGLFLAMLVVCSFCSVMILWVLKRPKPGDRKEKEGAYQQKRKAFVVVTVILITLVFGYGTVALVIVLRDHLPYHTYCLVLGLGWWTLLPSAAVQPYLYLSKVDKLPCIKSC